MESRRVSLVVAVLCLGLAPLPVGAQRKPAVQNDDAAMAVNMKKFQEIYGLATQLMNLGGNILNNNIQSPAGASAPANYRDGGGNGIFSEVRPQFKGLGNFDSGPAFDSFGSGGGGVKSSEYGGGYLGSAGSRSQPRSILDTLMGSFLGSSLGGGSQPTSSSSGVSSIFQPNFDDYGSRQSRYGNTRSGSNIDAIVDALSRTGAKRAVPEDSGGLNAGSLLSQFFGGGRR